MVKLAIIGGTGLTSMEGFSINSTETVKTPYGEASGLLCHGRLFDRELTFLARHGDKHTIAPHKINYRANIWALQSVGVKQIIAFAAVGGITQSCAPTTIAIPDQLIDYTHGREHTYFEGDDAGLEHIGFSYPYTESLRCKLIKGAQDAGVNPVSTGTYGITQGPRLETAAEISRMRNDGCTIVGMTGMPEAALARELGLEYAVLTMVVNWAAGMEAEEINFDEVEEYIKIGSQQAHSVLKSTVAIL